MNDQAGCLPPTDTVFRDWKTGLAVFGIAQVLLGSLCGLMVPFMLLGAALSKAAGAAANGQAMSPMLMLPGVLMYVAFAAWFIWMGIGSILARRWARALILTASWLWLVGGVSGFLVMGLILPDMYDQMSSGGQVPSAVMSVIKVVAFVFMALLYIVLPGALVLFYGCRHVKATCEFYNPAPAWTDACPLPVLAMSLLFGLWTVSVPTVGFYGWTIPLFGFIVGGPAGAAVSLATAAVSGYVAWGSFRLDRRAWACSVALVLAWALSVGLTFTRHSLFDYYEALDFPEEQLALMKPFWDAHAPLFTGLSCLWFAALLGYLFYTRRFYSAGNECTVK